MHFVYYYIGKPSLFPKDEVITVTGEDYMDM